jgi:hypothetical protein
MSGNWKEHKETVSEACKYREEFVIRSWGKNVTQVSEVRKFGRKLIRWEIESICVHYMPLNSLA